MERLPLGQRGGLEGPQTGQALVSRRSDQHRWGAGAWGGGRCSSSQDKWSCLQSLGWFGTPVTAARCLRASGTDPFSAATGVAYYCPILHMRKARPRELVNLPGDSWYVGSREHSRLKGRWQLNGVTAAFRGYRVASGASGVILVAEVSPRSRAVHAV